jgi:hypothetical protein
MLWNMYCLIRLSVIYRGRAVPLVWCVLQHGSAQVAFEIYRELLERAALVLPRRCKVIFLTDRGFADTDLMAYLSSLGWHWRIRIKSSFWLYRRRHRRCKVERLAVARGHMCCWQQVGVTEKCYGPVHLAVARPQSGNDVWYVLSDEPADVTTLEEYGLRFDIEENFLDDKSNGHCTTELWTRHFGTRHISNSSSVRQRSVKPSSIAGEYFLYFTSKRLAFG